MTRYLIVAHQTADSPHLLDAVAEIVRSEPDAEFGMVVPATHVEHLTGWTEGESRVAAAAAGERARAALAERGVELTGVAVGDANPLHAVTDALNEAAWDHVVVSTLRPGASRWLKMDAVSRLRRALPIPLTHIAAD